MLPTRNFQTAAANFSRREFALLTTTGLAGMLLGSQEARGADAGAAKAACHIDLKVIARSLPATVSGSFKVLPTAEFDTFSEEDKKLVYAVIPADKVGKRIWPVFERSLCAEEPKVMKEGAEIIAFLKTQAQRLGLIPAGASQPFSGVDAAFMIRLGNSLSGGMDLPLLGDNPSSQFFLLFSAYSLRALKQLSATADHGISISKVAVPQNLTKTTAEFSRHYASNKELTVTLDKIRNGQEIPFEDPRAQTLILPLVEAIRALARYRIRLTKTSLVATSKDKNNINLGHEEFDEEKQLNAPANEFFKSKDLDTGIRIFKSAFTILFYCHWVRTTDGSLCGRNSTSGYRVDNKSFHRGYLAMCEMFLPWLTTMETRKNLLSPFSLAISTLNRLELKAFENANLLAESDPCRVFSALQGKPDVRATAAEICALLAK